MGSYQENVHNTSRTAPVFKNISYLPGWQNVQIDLPPSPKRELPWIARATNWIGITMSTPETPRGWSFNPATVTLALIVAGGILTGGYLWGENVTERRHLMERIKVAEDKAGAADEKATYAVAGKDKQDGHGPNANTNQKTK